MSLPGFGTAMSLRKYEDYTSLKKYINAAVGTQYDGVYTYEIMKNGVTLTTGATPLEMLSIENGAVAFIGKTELTLVGYCSANDAGDELDGAIATLVYKDQDGEEHTATCTVNATNTTEVAFVGSDGSTAVTDYYCSVSCTIDTVVTAGNTFLWGATGAGGLAGFGGVIAAGATAAVQATGLGGVGNIWGRSHTDDAGGLADGSILYLDYYTPWGEVKRDATCTLTTTSTNEIRFIEADGTTYVKDFYRVISLVTDTTTTADTHEALIGDDDFNVNGGGGDCYGCINELTDSAVIMRVTAPHTNAECDMFLGKVFATTTNGGEVNEDYYQLYIKLTPYGDKIEKTLRYDFGGSLSLDLALKLEPDTNVTYLVGDTGEVGNIAVTAWYILAKEL